MSEKEKSAGQLLKEKLFRNPKNAGSTLSEEEIKAAFEQQWALDLPQEERPGRHF